MTQSNDSIHLAASYSNGACALDSDCQHEYAEELHRKALEMLERVLGKDHPNTIIVLNSLARNLKSQGKYEESTALLKKGTRQ